MTSGDWLKRTRPLAFLLLASLLGVMGLMWQQRAAESRFRAAASGTDPARVLEAYRRSERLYQKQPHADATPPGHLYGRPLLLAARASADGDGAYWALVTVMTGTDFLPGHRVEAARQLAAHFAHQLPHLVSLMVAISTQEAFDAAPVLREFVHHSKHSLPMRAAATYALAEWILRREPPSEARDQELVHLLGFAAEHGRQIRHPVFTEYTIADVAGALLRELVDFDVGKPAPSIEGQDLQGRPMRLAEYRGKIVLLYFWGDW